jgi:peptidoglycan/LPS O-acetylase OafA/YrhL
MTARPGTGRNAWLQVLRAVAALAVLYHHLGEHLKLVPALAPFAAGAKWSFSGLDVFFVLSGYVVYQSADRPRFNGRAFLLRRGLRIYLGYWPVLALVALSAWATATWPAAGDAVRNALLLQPDHRRSWVPTAWSLTYELYFYVWIALLCLAPARWRLGGLLAAMALLLAWNLGWFLLAREAVIEGRQPLDFLLASFGTEFLAGSAWAHLRRRHAGLHSARAARCSLLAGAALVVLGFWLAAAYPASFFIGAVRVLSFGVMAFGCLLAALALDDLGLHAPVPLVAVGDASFSLYLLHLLAMEWADRLRAAWLPPGGPVLTAFLLALPLAIVLLALAWYRRVERPLFEHVAGSAWVRRVSAG